MSKNKKQLRQKISFKGVIIGAVADIVGSNIWGVIVVVYIILQYKLSSLPAAEQVSRLQHIMLQDPIIIGLNWIIGGGFTVLGGYIAARIAKRDELLNGTLASFLCVIFTLFAVGTVPIYQIVLGIIANPLLGLGGGYLQQRQK